MFIAEIGINHNGELKLAKKLIKAAHKAGADVVKFQKRTPRICVPESQWDIMRETPWGQMTYIDYKERIEFGKKEYDQIDRYCKQLGISWTVSVWDLLSLDFALQYDLPFIKVPSALLTNDALLNRIREKKLRVVLSTGMSTMKEIAHAVEILSGCPLTLLSCNSSYPTIDEEIDLNVMTTLKEKFNVPVGYSGHETDILPTIIAKAMGAEVIERHITLDKTMWGTDHKASLEPKELSQLIQTLNRIEKIKGSSDVKVYQSEEKVKNKLRI